MTKLWKQEVLFCEHHHYSGCCDWKSDSNKS